MIVCIGIILIIGLMIFYCYFNYKQCKDYLEKILYILLIFVLIVPFIIYCLDRYNIPTYLGFCIDVDSQNWLAFIANYSAGIISATISAVILVIVTIEQIKKNNEDNIKRDKENLRVQNMPILKYSINTENKSKGELEELIVTNIDKGNTYNLNISIKNIGLNNVKNIKVDFKANLINSSVYRILGSHSIEVLEKEEEIILNRFFALNSSEEPYNITIIVYYEDVLSNWYRQTLNINYTATSVLKTGENIGIAIYKVNKEEIIKESDIERNILWIERRSKYDKRLYKY